MGKIKNIINKTTSKELLINQEDKTFEKKFLLKENFIGFKGHFPKYPILPAFIQILFAETVIEEYEKKKISLLSIKKAKFIKEIKPIIEITINCKIRDSFSYLVLISSRGGEKLSKFILNYEERIF